MTTGSTSQVPVLSDEGKARFNEIVGDLGPVYMSSLATLPEARDPAEAGDLEFVEVILATASPPREPGTQQAKYGTSPTKPGK